MQEVHENIKKLAEELAKKLGFQAEVRVLDDSAEEGAFRVVFRVNSDQHFLIGQRGANLSALQHLFRALYRKQGGDASKIAIDINDYVKEKEELLFQDVDKVVNEVLAQKMSVALRPMLSFERKLVHRYLSNHPSVTTESTGAGEQRKIFVRPRVSADDVPETLK